MATICLAYGLTPGEYRLLTVAEHRAFRDLLKELGKER